MSLLLQFTDKVRTSLLILLGPEIPWCSFWMVVDMPVGVQATGVWFRQSEHWILREMTLFMGAMLGSTVDAYSALVLGWLLEEFQDFLRDWVDYGS